MKPSDFFEGLGLRFPGMPRLQPAGGFAPLQFASSGGSGGGGYDDPDDDFYDEYDEEPEPRRADEEPREARQPTAARRRTVQSEPDERYWTDYLRIALPVIGLLLVIAVFWFWAQQLIDDPEDDLSPTETPGLAEVIESPTQEPAVQQEVVATPPDQVAQQDQTQEQAPPESTQAPVVTPTPLTAEQPADPAAEGDAAAEAAATEAPPVEEAAGGIGPDMEVSVIEGPLNMRAEASTESDIVATLDTGALLTVLSGPTEGESYIWWNVVDNSTGDQGWVAEEFIQPAG